MLAFIRVRSRPVRSPAHEDELTAERPAPVSLSDALRDADSLDAPLAARLAAYRADSGRLRPDFARGYDELVARLAALDRGNIGPQVGDRLTEFNLPDANGRLVSLASLLRSGPAVVSLNRGHWCPYCRLELRALAAVHDEIRGLGAWLVSIMPEGARFTGAYARRNALPFPILSDIDLGYALALGLVFWVGAEVQRLYEEAGIDLAQFQGNGGFFLPVAAKFVVGQDGRIKARQVNVEFRQRMEPAAVVAALRAHNVV
jgi:peroxiredoxin